MPVSHSRESSHLPVPAMQSVRARARVLLGLLGFLVAPAGASAQDDPACSAPEARAFDFWIGDWEIGQEILDQDGTWLRFDAATSVSPTLDGCALIERWRGTVQFFWEGMRAPEPMQGLSIRAFDPQSGKWNIYWMDTRRPRFDGVYTGALSAGRGEFFRDWESPQGPRRGRISFSSISSDSVDWELAISADQGRTWSSLWIMHMHRGER